jgi:hypothetical protein
MTTPTTAGTPATPVRIPAAATPAKAPAPPARVLPPPKPPQPRNPVAAAAKPPAPAAGSVKPVQRVVKASELTSQDFFTRLNWLENVYKHHRAFIKDLTARLQRTGTAVPNMPHFDPLKSAAGDIDPNVG